MYPAGGGVWSGLLADSVVRDALGRARTIRDLHGVGEVGSTQDVALALAERGAASGTLVIADRQTSGRGRGGRRWDDHPDGRTLALTVLLDVEGLPDPGLVPHALGLAVLDAAAAVVPTATALRLKWPNDVVHRTQDGSSRKLCGILVERERVAGTRERDVLLCGVGIDVDLRDVDGAADRTCLAELAGVPLERGRLLAGVISSIDEMLPLLFDPVSLIERYRLMSDTIGRQVRVEPVAGERIVGLATDIDDLGRLVVTTSGHRHAILSGTIRDASDARGRGP